MTAVFFEKLYSHERKLRRRGSAAAERESVRAGYTDFSVRKGDGHILVIFLSYTVKTAGFVIVSYYGGTVSSAVDDRRWDSVLILKVNKLKIIRWKDTKNMNKMRVITDSASDVSLKWKNDMTWMLFLFRLS